MKTWVCNDTIDGFNTWLPSLTFSIDTNGEEARTVTLVFTINDLGQVSINNEPELTATATVRIQFRALPALVQPPGQSGTLTITAAVAGAVGLLVIALIAFFLKRKLGEPDDKYFAEATMPLDSSHVSPLYKSPFTEHFNVLYNPNFEEGSKPQNASDASDS